MHNKLLCPNKSAPTILQLIKVVFSICLIDFTSNNMTHLFQFLTDQSVELNIATLFLHPTFSQKNSAQSANVHEGVSWLNHRADKGLKCGSARTDTQCRPPGGNCRFDVGESSPLVRTVPPPPLPPVALSSASCRPTGGVSPLRPERSATRCKCGGSDSAPP